MNEISISPGIEAAWQIAAGEAARSNHPHIRTEHILLGIFSFQKLLAIKDKIGLSPEKLRDLLRTPYKERANKLHNRRLK